MCAVSDDPILNYLFRKSQKFEWKTKCEWNTNDWTHLTVLNKAVNSEDHTASPPIPNPDQIYKMLLLNIWRECISLLPFYPFIFVYFLSADFGVSAKNSKTLQRRDSFIGTPYWWVRLHMIHIAIQMWYWCIYIGINISSCFRV